LVDQLLGLRVEQEELAGPEQDAVATKMAPLNS
jgi:hypothetical protein